MSVVHTPESPYGRELWKWDHTVNERNPVTGEPGKRPVGFQEYPKMLYQAERVSAKVTPTVLHVAHDADEERRMASRGFRASQQAALDAFHATELDLGKAHANRNFHEQRMTPQAQDEARAVETAAGEMLGEIPEVPKKRRGRKPSVKELA